MFTVVTTPEEITLQSATAVATIWPKKGALLNSFKVTKNGTAYEVIDGYDSFADFDANAETKGFRSCKLSPYVCRLNGSTYTYEGKTYQIGKYIVNGSSLHGLLYNENFELIDSKQDANGASVTLRHQYRASDAGFPFSFAMEVTYTLSDANRLTIATVIKNNGDATFPLADGWHPYFKLGGTLDECHLQIASATQVEFNEFLIPNGNTIKDDRFAHGASMNGVELDNCFVLENGEGYQACVLSNPSIPLSLTIFAEKNYPYLQLYTPPHRNSIAIENLSGTPDCFNNHMGLLDVAPGEEVAFVATYQIS